MKTWSCRDCRFRKPDPRPEYSDHGECRRHPPTPMCWTGNDGYGNPDARYEQHWPWMKPSDWCGDWESNSRIGTPKLDREGAA